ASRALSRRFERGGDARLCRPLVARAARGRRARRGRAAHLAHLAQLVLQRTHCASPGLERVRDLARPVRGGNEAAGTAGDVDAVREKREAQLVVELRVAAALQALETELQRIEI